MRFIWPSLWPLHGNSISLKIMTLAVSYHAIETHCLSLYLSLLSSSWSKGPKEAGNRTLEQRYVVGGESVRVWRQEIGNWWKYDYWNRISCLEFIMKCQVSFLSDQVPCPVDHEKGWTPQTESFLLSRVRNTHYHCRNHYFKVFFLLQIILWYNVRAHF